MHLNRLCTKVGEMLKSVWEVGVLNLPGRVEVCGWNLFEGAMLYRLKPPLVERP